MKNHDMQNVRLVAVNHGSEDYFDIFLDFSGQREYLISHRHNGMLYAFLRDGVTLGDMNRMSHFSGRKKPELSRRMAVRFEKNVRHLLSVTEDYISERNNVRRLEADALRVAA